jgi:hypothetical protein
MSAFILTNFIISSTLLKKENIKKKRRRKERRKEGRKEGEK